MKKRRIWCACRLIIIYMVLYILATVLLILLFQTSLLKNIDVFMYRGMVLIVVSSGVSAGCMLFLKWIWFRKFIDVKDICLLFCGCCCVNMVLFTLIPVTVERSVSVFMLSYMEENSENRFTEDDIEHIFIEKYVNEYAAFDKRFHEQAVTGSIVENNDGTYSISKRGKFIVSIFRMIAKWFHTDQRLVYPNEN